MMPPMRVLIMGAAGRDFHSFDTFSRDRKSYQVVAPTAAQIPNIEDEAGYGEQQMREFERQSGLCLPTWCSLEHPSTCAGW